MKIKQLQKVLLLLGLVWIVIGIFISIFFPWYVYEKFGPEVKCFYNSIHIRQAYAYHLPSISTPHCTGSESVENFSDRFINIYYVAGLLIYVPFISLYFIEKYHKRRTKNKS